MGAYLGGRLLYPISLPRISSSMHPSIIIRYPTSSCALLHPSIRRHYVPTSSSIHPSSLCTHFFIHPSGPLPSPTPQNLRQGLSVAAISLHSLLTEAEFSSCWMTLQMDQSNHIFRSKFRCDTWPVASPGSPPPPPAKTFVTNTLSEIILMWHKCLPPMTTHQPGFLIGWPPVLHPHFHPSALGSPPPPSPSSSIHPHYLPYVLPSTSSSIHQHSVSYLTPSHFFIHASIHHHKVPNLLPCTSSSIHPSSLCTHFFIHPFFHPSIIIIRYFPSSLPLLHPSIHPSIYRPFL